MTAFPWYDSFWLAAYVEAKTWLSRTHPRLAAELEERLAPLKTNPRFETRRIARVFDESTMAAIRATIHGMKPAQIELHEVRDFGRFIVHDHPYFSELQRGLVDLVGEAAGEPVEPCYNFLSLYTKVGVCAMHLDAPLAKWTLDICVEQSVAGWPIYFSQPVPWPEKPAAFGPRWQEDLKRAPELRFTAHDLQPGSAVLFSGSSQWHYRDALPRASGGEQFCNLLFFHFLPRGMKETADPQNWPRLLGVPELAQITGKYDYHRH